MKHAAIITAIVFAAISAKSEPTRQTPSLGEWSVGVFTNEWTGAIVYSIEGGNHDVKESHKTIATAAFHIELSNPEVKDSQFYFDPICSMWFSYKGAGDDALEFDLDTPMSRFRFDGKKPNGYAARFSSETESIRYYESEALLRSVMKSKHTDVTCYMLNSKSKASKKISVGFDTAGLHQAVHRAKLAFLKWGSADKSKTK